MDLPRCPQCRLKNKSCADPGAREHCVRWASCTKCKMQLSWRSENTALCDACLERVRGKRATERERKRARRAAQDSAEGAGVTGAAGDAAGGARLAPLARVQRGASLGDPLPPRVEVVVAGEGARRYTKDAQVRKVTIVAGNSADDVHPVSSIVVQTPEQVRYCLLQHRDGRYAIASFKCKGNISDAAAVVPIFHFLVHHPPAKLTFKARVKIAPAAAHELAALLVAGLVHARQIVVQRAMLDQRSYMTQLFPVCPELRHLSAPLLPNDEHAMRRIVVLWSPGDSVCDLFGTHGRDCTRFEFVGTPEHFAEWTRDAADHAVPRAFESLLVKFNLPRGVCMKWLVTRATSDEINRANLRARQQHLQQRRRPDAPLQHEMQIASSHLYIARCVGSDGVLPVPPCLFADCVARVAEWGSAAATAGRQIAPADAGTAASAAAAASAGEGAAGGLGAAPAAGAHPPAVGGLGAPPGGTVADIQGALMPDDLILFVANLGDGDAPSGSGFTPEDRGVFHSGS